MDDYSFDVVSDEEKDILQEIMNIAFGKAAADLAEVINIFVVLSVPDIQMLRAQDLPEYLKKQVSAYHRITIVEQNFWGEFKGSAFLAFQASAGRELVSLFGDGTEELGSEPIYGLEKETLMEVGNILIGACVGKLSELLGDSVTYSPPRVVTENTSNDAIPSSIFESYSSAIVLKTTFCFNERNVDGFLFLVTSNESIVWLKKALAKFMEQYE
ncbi:chemotaxis protein CheC [Accumulibacter sp.]|uniref:chemotaxis protein CheC n=1 Tax=Accumulibacter sp. TaxID=2053492 RepID=UPI0028C435B6|nr:chemotaxis protein CheC [Accumulibacter sp.]